MVSPTMQALCLLALAAGAYTNPVLLPTPPPVETGTTTDDAVGIFGTPTCTTVLTRTISGFRGDFTPEIAKTIYTKTVTEQEPVNCGGCALSLTTELASFWGGFGPQQIITGTTTARHATTTTLAVCLRHRTPPTHGQIRRDVEQPGASPSGECTYTKVIIPTPHLLGEESKTVFTATATTTSHIDCGGCNHIAVSTANPLHPGPMIPYTATTTASTPAAETAYVCLKSPSVVLLPSSPGTRPATTTSPPPAASPSAAATTHKTITRTVYAGTVTVVKTVTCGPMRGPGGQTTSQGAIPKREAITTDRRPRPKTETGCSTVVLSTSATWTRTSFHCVGRRHTPSLTPISGTGPKGVAERAALTAPPTHRPLPTGPGGTTSTFEFPHAR